MDPNDLKTMCKNNGQGSETHDHYFDAANIDELVSARFIENSIEGCNFATGKCLLWQYGLWSFQTGGTKLERFLPKNQYSTYPKEIFEF